MSHRVILTAFTSPCLGSQVLNRQEAKSRLQQLALGTEEYSKLQDALIRTAGIVEINLPTTIYRVDTSSENYMLLGGFGSSEHVAIGEAVKLEGLSPENTSLLDKGSVSIRFHHIVALAGDFYGVAGKAISFGETDQDKTERFKKAFNTLAKADNDEIRRVILEVDQECTAVKRSSLPHHCYSSHMVEKNNAIKAIKKDINDLLIDNSDHFSTNAADAYRIGHILAINKARNAGKQKDLKVLKRAYAIDAFACHFLTDLFAAGHIRNQRGPLETFLLLQLKFSKNQAKLLAGILTGAQHEKDGNEGLNVSDKEGRSWIAFGDGHFFTPKNKENTARAIAATKKSVDEVYHAYLNPASQDPSTVDQLIPFATPFNPLPLYLVERASLFLHQGSQKIEIKTQWDYLNTGLSQALRYLPQGYINGFITPDIEIPPVLDKIVISQIERLTGVIWHMVGLATYHQVKQENQQLNEKIDEAADTLKATYDNTEKILQQMQSVNSQLHQIVWSQLFHEIGEAISKIKDNVYMYKRFKDKLNDEQLKKIEEGLWSAHNKMSRLFYEGTVADGRKILIAYEKMLATNTPSMGPLEIKIAVTLWFRQMLDYQVQAFSLYATLQATKNGHQNELVKSQILIFETSLQGQVEINKGHIDEVLVYQSQNYIALQLKKSETKRSAFSDSKR